MAPVNAELAQIEADEALTCGGGVSVVSWHELAPEGPQVASRLAAWRRFATSAGFTV